MSMLPWKPKALNSLIEDYLAGATNFELSIKYEGSPDQVNRLLRYLVSNEELPTRAQLKENNYEVDFAYKGLLDNKEFQKFLLFARTKEEIFKQFGEDGETLLGEHYPGLNLFKQINNYGKEIFILLPEINQDEIKVKPREWQFHHSESTDGNFAQPYQLVQLPDSMFDNPEQEVIIAPLYDVHYGHFACKHSKLLSYLRWIEETPNILTFIGGDLIENALENDKGMTYSQEFPPNTQINDICKMLAPIANKVLFMLPGNHERRTEKRAGIDPTKIIANTLDIPCFSGPVYCSILGANYKWKMYVMHGNTFSQTKGGKLNSAGKPKNFIDFVNFIVSGHCHDSITNPETCIVEDPERCRLVYKTQWTVIAPSFLHWENSYAYQAGWPPPSKGGIALRIFKNGGYNATLSDKG